MNNLQKQINISGWLVFAITFIVFFLSAERSGSLWDCGEFILGAYKLQVVHPPGAPLFLLIGRFFALIAEVVSDNPADIAFAVNLLSGVCTAGAAMFLTWSTYMLTKLALVDRATEKADTTTNWVALASGIVAGLTGAFCTSVWFSAVEGEVYAMSTFFTVLTFWSVVKWYYLPDVPSSDRYLLFGLFCIGLSIGVHLLSLLIVPAIALLYYFKKYKNTTLMGMAIATGIGVLAIALFQVLIITGIPNLWVFFELIMVNSLGMPFHSGLIPTLLIIAAILYSGMRYAQKKNSQLLQNIVIAAFLSVIGFSTVGVVIIRANAETPINMNVPSDALRLLPYLNREQYGERPMLKGPHFDGNPVGTTVEDRYGRVGDKYEIVDRKIEYEWNERDMILFPRIGHSDQGRKQLHRGWMEYLMGDSKGRPSMAYNLKFFWTYQIKWMYWRYFMWNFSGRQNGDQGYFPFDHSKGNWITGIGFVDRILIGDQSQIPESFKNNHSRNTYFALPFIFGLLGLVFHFRRRRNDFLALLAMFLITGLGIIVYSNQPPNEPRERDYVLAGSFITFAIWVGMGVAALFSIIRHRLNQPDKIAAVLSFLIVLLAPLLMGFQNFDDHSRRHLHGARDFAANFLNSCDPDAIIFTYGDNDTYPLWYAQEVEGIRTDVRVVNLSLIAVDWYINMLRRKVNDSAPIKLAIPEEAYRGMKRNQVYLHPDSRDQPMPLKDFVKFVGDEHPLPLAGGRKTESYLPTTNLFIPIDSVKAVQRGLTSPGDSTFTKAISFNLKKNLVSNTLLKGDLAVLDILASNYDDRPIYFAITCRDKSLLGLDEYLRLEGLSLKLVPNKNKAERAYGMAGKGSVDIDKIYNRLMNDFQWGNFDKNEMYVDDSFKPSLSAHRLVFSRTIQKLLERQDAERALNLADKFFEAFPHRNFPMDYSAVPMLATYIQARNVDRGRVHFDNIIEELSDRLEYYFSLSPEEIEAGYRPDFQASVQAMEQLFRYAEGRDADLESKLESRLGIYRTQANKN